MPTNNYTVLYLNGGKKEKLVNRVKLKLDYPLQLYYYSLMIYAIIKNNNGWGNDSDTDVIAYTESEIEAKAYVSAQNSFILDLNDKFDQLRQNQLLGKLSNEEYHNRVDSLTNGTPFEYGSIYEVRDLHFYISEVPRLNSKL